MKIDNITIEQFMLLQLASDTYQEENKLISEYVKILHGNLNIPKKEADKLLKDVMEILQAKPDFIHRFTFNGVEYGFIPNLNDISVGEFIDLDEYVKDGKQLHKIAAILYRPIIKSNGKLYEIEKYEGTAKYENIMKGVNCQVVLGALVFFYNLGNSLLSNTAIYIQKETKKMNKMKKKED